MKELKVATYYDWINHSWGGAEKVLLDILEVFPNSDIYTICYDPKKANWLPKKNKVITSFLDKLPGSHNNPIFYTPLYDIAIENFNLNQYDIVISTTSNVGHCLITQPHTLHACYYHNINRYLYQTPPSYLWLKPLLNIYKKIDKIYSLRPDLHLCNSNTVAKRLSKNLNIIPKIIHPGIDLNIFKPNKTRQTSDYFLVVTRLVPHKRIDLVIEAAKVNRMKLKVIGGGRHFDYLKSISSGYGNIELLGQLPLKNTVTLMQSANAVICPQLEDFGIVPLESQACGVPVIGFNKGGNTETIIHNKTGYLFNEQTTDCLVNAIKSFESISIKPDDCRNQASKFDRQIFMLNFKQEIIRAWEKHQK